MDNGGNSINAAEEDYGELNPLINPSSNSLNSEEGERRPVTLERGTDLYHRQKYYQKLFDHEEISVLPQHVIPSAIFFPFDQFYPASEDDQDLEKIQEGDIPESQKHGSATIIFGLWNTMMGSGLLAVPWGFLQSGLILGIVVMSVICATCCYTCWLVHIHSHMYADFSEAVHIYCGKTAGYIALSASVMVLFGAIIAYDSLMSDSLYLIVKSIRVLAAGEDEVLSPGADEPIWAKEQLIPLYILFVLYPVSCMRDISPVIRFNSFGLISVAYMLGFLTISCIFFNGFSNPEIIDLDSFGDSEEIKFPIDLANSHFYYLGGMAIMMFFIHNAIGSVVRTARDKTKIKRDMIISFVLVLLSYCSVGGIGYASYRYLGACLPQNFLDESVYPVTDIPAVIARCALLLQLVTVLTLLIYIMRIQFCGKFLATREPPLKYIIILNCVVLFTATAISSLFPDAVATTLRYTGAFCGFAYCFLFPVVVNYLAKKSEGGLLFYEKVLFVWVVGLALFLLATQFVPQHDECTDPS